MAETKRQREGWTQYKDTGEAIANGIIQDVENEWLSAEPYDDSERKLRVTVIVEEI